MKLISPGMRNGFPFRIFSIAEDNQPFSEWDGFTYYNETPSKSSDSQVTVYGPGSLYCLRLTFSQVIKLYWKAKKMSASMSSDVFTGSANATASYSGVNGTEWSGSASINIESMTPGSDSVDRTNSLYQTFDEYSNSTNHPVTLAESSLVVPRPAFWCNGGSGQIGGERYDTQLASSFQVATKINRDNGPYLTGDSTSVSCGPGALSFTSPFIWNPFLAGSDMLFWLNYGAIGQIIRISDNEYWLAPGVMAGSHGLSASAQGYSYAALNYSYSGASIQMAFSTGLLGTPGFTPDDTQTVQAPVTLHLLGETISGYLACHQYKVTTSETDGADGFSHAEASGNQTIPSLTLEVTDFWQYAS